MADFEVIVECPVHKKPVYLAIEAGTPDEAIKKALGMTVSCPWGPIDELGHNFVVGFRRGREEILGVSALPWKPPVLVSAAPSLTPLEPTPPTPLETVYYVDPMVAERQLRKLRWWER